MKKIRKTLISLLIAAAVFFGSATVSAATISSGSTFASTDGTSGRLVINSVNSSISGSTWNVSVNCTINMVNSWLYTGGANYDRYFVGTINGVNGYLMQIKSRTESWSSGTSHSFTYSMALPVNPDNNVVSASFRVIDGNGALNDVATFDTGSGYTVSLQAVQKATGLTLNATSKTLYTTDTFTVVPTVSPSDTYNKTVNYSTSNASVASVSSGGVITARKAGNAIITATTADGSNIASNISVTVLQHVTSISTNVSAPVLYTGETFQLLAQAMPDDASNKTLTYYSADTSVATISDSGLITALKAGNTTITITTTDGSGVSKTLPLTVRQKAASIAISNSVSELYINTLYQLNIDILPSDTTDKSVSFSSSDASIATVSESGIVTPLKKGTVTVTATTRDSTNLSTSMTFTVKQHVESITLSESDLTLYTGEGKTITSTVLPEDADNKQCSFSSSNETVAVVNDDGKVTALKAGTAVITIETLDGSGIKTECLVTVKQYAEGIDIGQYQIELPTDTSYRIPVKVFPNDTSDLTLTFESSDENIAVIDETGLITAKNPGTIQVTVIASDRGTVKSVLTVKVIRLISSIDVPSDELEIYMGQSKKLDFTLSPADATNKDITFIIDAPDIISVSPDGTVTAKAPGIANITISANDESGVSKTVAITVRQSITSITIDNDNITLYPQDTYELAPKILPDDAYNKNLSFASSDLSVASVDDQGKITANQVGKAVVTIKTTDGSEKSVKVKITVLQPIESSNDNDSPDSKETSKDEVIDNNHDITANYNNDIQDGQEKAVSQVESTEKENHTVENNFNPSSDEYLWYDYLFIILGIVSCIACILYLIFILIIRRKKDKEDQEEDHDHKER